MNASLNRRRLLGITITFPLFLSAFCASAGSRLAHALTSSVPALTGHQLAMLERIAYLLFPFPQLGMEPYQRVVTGMQQAAGKQADLISLVTEGVALLDSAAEQAWLDLPQSEQIALLKQIENSAFFQWALPAARSRLFQDPQVWALIGYEGSSLEKGGYLHRGLNDIDWLDQGVISAHAQNI
jgi:hypothetical protein